MKLKDLLNPTKDSTFDYQKLVGYFCKLLNKYVSCRPSLPDDISLSIYRPLYEKEWCFVIGGLYNVLNDKAHSLYEQNKSLPKNKQVFIPSSIRIRIDPNDKKKDGGFLNNINVAFGVSKEAFDKEEGTVTVLDRSMTSRALRRMAIPDDVLPEQIDESVFKLTFKWLDNSRFERTSRSLDVVGNNSDQKMTIVGNLCMGSNFISGPNGGHPSDGINRIRLSSDEFQMDFIRVEVLSEKNVTITLLDSRLNADIDGVPLAFHRTVPFYEGAMLNLGLCTLKLS